MTKTKTFRHLFLAIALTCLSMTFVKEASAQTASTLNEIKSRKELRVGWAVFYPYIYLDPQRKKITGFEADFMEEMNTSLNVKLVWDEDSWQTLLVGLEKNRYELNLRGVAIRMHSAEVVI